MTCRIAAPEELSALVAARAASFATRSPAGTQANAQLFSDQWDEQRNSRSYWLRNQDGTATGTIRVSLFCSEFDWQSIPAISHFPVQVRQFTEKGGAVQTSMMGVLPSFRSSDLVQTLALLRTGIVAARLHSIRDFVAIVDAQNSKLGLWQRLGFRKQTSPVSHPIALKGAVLIAASIQDMISSAQASTREQAVASSR